MPHTSSAWKSMRQTEKRRQYNRKYRKMIKEVVKVAEAPDPAATPEAKQAAYNAAAAKLDKAAARKVIHPNKAARKKSQLARALNKAKAAPAAAK